MDLISQKNQARELQPNIKTYIKIIFYDILYHV